MYLIFKQGGVSSEGRDVLTSYIMLCPDRRKFINLGSIEEIIDVLKEEISENVSKSDPSCLETTMEFSFHPGIDITIFCDYRCISA